MLYRIVQEWLTNTLKHAHASCVDVEIRYTDNAVKIARADDRRGRPADSRGGHGLVGTRERAALYGGAVHAGTAPAAGSRSRVSRCASCWPTIRSCSGRRAADLRNGGVIPVVGEAADGFEAVRQARLLEADVVLMDVRMAPRRLGGHAPDPRRA